VSTTSKVRDPTSAAEKVGSGGSCAPGSVEAKCTALAKLVATLSYGSNVVTPSATGWPATTVAGRPDSERRAAAPGWTVTCAMPIAEGAALSTTTKVRGPAVLKTTVAVIWPPSAGLKVTSPGVALRVSSVANSTVPR
jgi:hypothetical protein